MIALIPIIILAILIFAVYGFVAFLVFVFRQVFRESSPPPSYGDKYRESVLGRALSTAKQLDTLAKDGLISKATYEEVRGVLESRFGGTIDLPPRVEPGQPVPATDEGTRESARPRDVEVISAELVEPLPVADTPSTHTPELVQTPDLAQATEPVESSGAVRPDSSSVPTPEREGVVVAASAAAASPFDVEDSQPRVPRRSVKEMLSGFMEKRNIRWGELASGILIVGSAVGLVFSLRDELQDRIPYFSALLFMLITGAIHAAGIYTLKKWKLRNTSRGVLVIGMLLIPINFLAACILTGSGSEKRELTDPLYWTAVLVGISSFGAMSWWGSQSLLRKYGLPLFASVLGVSVWTLVVNRSEPEGNLSIVAMGLIAPACLTWLLSVWRIIPRQWSRTSIGVRLENRLLMVLGISVFALANVVLLMLVRSPNRLQTLLGVVPAFSVVAIVVAAVGGMIRKSGVSKTKSEIVGMSLTILGASVATIGAIATAFNPLMAIANSLVGAVGWLAVARNRQWPLAWLGFWGVASVGVVSASHGIQTGELSQWLSPLQVAAHWIRGTTGLILMLLGIGAVAVSRVPGLVGAGGSSQTHSPWSLPRINLWCGALLCVVGCGLALAASFLDPENIVDAHIATALLGLMALGSLVAAVRSSLDWLPLVAGGVLYAFLAHLLLWNPHTVEWFDEVAPSLVTRWLLVFGAGGLVTSVAGFYRRALGRPTDWFTSVAMGSSALAIVMALQILEQQSGLGAYAGLVLMVTWFLMGWHARVADHGLSLVAGTTVGLGLIVADLIVRSGWSPELFHLKHAVIQMSIAALVCLIWGAVRNWSPPSIASQFGFSRSLDHRHPESIGQLVFSLGFALLTFVTVTDQAGFEFSRDWVSRFPESFSVVGQSGFVLTASVVLFGAAVLGYLFRPGVEFAVCLTVTWFAAWFAGSSFFAESNSVGSAARWLIPIGGILAALLFQVIRQGRDGIEQARLRMRLAPVDGEQASSLQVAINTALAISVLSVLAISTVTIATVMLNGPEALGGPLKPSWLGDLRKDVSFGVPIAILVATFLIYAISEKRSLLAALGSTVFQYVVVLAIVLLALSPNPKLASVWFVNILQTVSLGMTGYGLIWFWARDRIGGGEIKWLYGAGKLKQLDIHTILNLVLIGSLMVLILQRYFSYPTNSAGWITSVGGPLGVASIALATLLVVLVWRESLDQIVPWAVGFLGLSVSAIGATLVDRYTEGAAWQAYRVISLGTAVTVVVQLIVNAYRDTRFWKAAAKPWGNVPWFASWNTTSSMTVLGAVCVLFSVRGLLGDVEGFWLNFACLSAVLAATIAYGWIYYSNLGAVVSVALTILWVSMFCELNPMGWFGGPGTAVLIIQAAVVVLAICWVVVYLLLRASRRPTPPRRFVWFPNWTGLLVGVWLLGLGVLEHLAQEFGKGVFLENVWIQVITGASVLLLAIQLWNDRAKFRLVSRFIAAVGLGILVAALIGESASSFGGQSDAFGFAASLLSMGVVGLFFSSLWAWRKPLTRTLAQLRVPRLVASVRQVERQLPIHLIVLSLLVLLLVWPAIFALDARLLRYMMAFSPMLLAGSIGILSETHRRRWLQMVFLTLLVVSAIILSWAGLSLEQMTGDTLEVVSRLLMVLAFGVFVNGVLVTRWVRHGDRWISSFRLMTVCLSGLSLATLCLCLLLQWSSFDPVGGSGLAPVSVVGSGMMVLGMIAGLIVISVLPAHDPLVLPMSGRKAYIYLAQAMLVLLGLHLYLGMPWLLKLGVLKYWPYVALAISFGGIGVSSLLQKRKLEVLSEPLFNTAALVPLLVSIGFWMVRSESDAALTLLASGLIYLTVSLMHRSLIAGALSVVLGNLALWTFYQKMPQFSFFEHPQLWLIPPALSVLAASQLLRERLTPTQLGLIRYVSSFVIYLSSTGEIFIQGLGQSLWPPMVLAVLSLAGMAAGVLLQVRSFLYVGVMFLFMSMVAMVSHAHRQFDHIWPWWAFGICVGALILVGFGLMEKRRNDLTALSRKLKQWDV